jgi:dTMP kinase
MPISSSDRFVGHKFVVIEGVDGVGKTTVAKALASILGGVYYRTPSVTLEAFVCEDSEKGRISLRGYVDQLALRAPKTRFLFYLFSVSEASNKIAELLEVSHVVCDRYLASTLAYHRVLDPTLRHTEVGWLSVIKPDFEFLLEVNDDDEQLRRLAQRPPRPRSDDLLEQDPMYLSKVKKEFRQLGLHVVDTTARSVESVLTEILDHMGLTGACLGSKQSLQEMYNGSQYCLVAS